MSIRKIALVDESAKMGGVEFSTLWLAEKLDPERFHPIVICPREGELPQRCREKGIDVRILRVPSFFWVSTQIRGQYYVNPFAILADGLLFLPLIARLVPFLRRERIDLVCTKGMLAHFYGGVAARLAGVPCVWHLQDVVSSERAFGLFPKFVRWGSRLLADHVIADAKAIVDQLGMGADPRVTVVYNGVDTDQFSPHVDGRGVRLEFGIPEDVLVIGNVARLSPWKGQRYFIEAAADLAREFPHVHFLVVGGPVFDSPEYEQELRALADRLGLSGRLTFTGFRWDLPQVLAAMDVFTHASVQGDSGPITVISAMAAGRPVVATAVDGVRELFQDGVDGMLVSPEDSPALARALRQLLTDDQLRTCLGRGARRKVVNELSLEHFARGCEGVFEAVLEKKRS